MASEQSNNKTLEKFLGITRTKTAAAAVDITMEKLLQRIQTPPIYPMGQPSPPSAQPSGQKPLHAPPLSSAWAHTPPSVNLTAHPIRFYTSSPVQPSHPSGHPPPHASPIAVGQKPSKLSSVYNSASLYSSANLYSSTNLSVDPLQQPFFYRNRADQHHNRLGIEAGESSTPSGYGQPYVRGLGINQTYRRAVFEVSNSLAQIDIPMYFKNPVISLPNVPSNYITNSVAFSAQSLTHDNGKPILVCEYCKKQRFIPRFSVGNSTVGPQEATNAPPTSISQSLGLISVDGTNLWILDSGATDHLTGFSEHFVTYTPCAGNEEIWIADGSLAPIAGKGQIVLYDGFSLQNVLHVPKLSYNLLSISKITRELHYKVTFLLESVCFQDLNLGRTIGTARCQGHNCPRTGREATSYRERQVALNGSKQAMIEGPSLGVVDATKTPEVEAEQFSCVLGEYLHHCVDGRQKYWVLTAEGKRHPVLPPLADGPYVGDRPQVHRVEEEWEQIADIAGVCLEEASRSMEEGVDRERCPLESEWKTKLPFNGATMSYDHLSTWTWRKTEKSSKPLMTE
ncbi:TMV resistance protein N [Cucumis melo var. makuwa]|uniref:TMV resistance protein N n=1 Tax=Cucumis melo var. makuwa TaxID=1194695 RepID=A0A5D3BVA8_CUCMM|nr:TMV resistance protein N [Cucumis melo var. makuwa]